MKNFWPWALSLFGVFCVATHADAQIVLSRIEEDWELQVTQPDVQLDAPQITTSMLPFGPESEVLMQFDLNHATDPSFSDGGMQMRVCSGDVCVAQHRLFESQKLSHESETIVWTQVIQKVDGGYLFGVANGSSQTWGTFGGEATLLPSAAGDGALNAYQPLYSVENSAVTFAGNRVASLRLKRIRVYNEDGEVRELIVDREVAVEGAED